MHVFRQQDNASAQVRFRRDAGDSRNFASDGIGLPQFQIDEWNELAFDRHAIRDATYT